MSSNDTSSSVRSSWTETFYSLNSGSVDSELERLNSNHCNVWLPLAGHVLSPSILEELKQIPRPRVADVATGTGVWLSSLAGYLPEAELFGFDFDPVKFPDPAPFPNIMFRQQNVLLPFPEELRGTFNVVHVRLLLVAIKAGDYERVATNLYQLLKPGGRIVWEEASALSFRSCPPSKAFEEFTRVEILQALKNEQDPRGPALLPNALLNAGFQNCDTKIRSSWAADKHVQDAACLVSLGIVRPFMKAVVEDGGIETVRTIEDVERLHRTLTKEFRDGTRVGFDFITVEANR